MGYQTQRNKVLQGITPQGTTLNTNISVYSKQNSKNILGCEFGDYMGSIHGKNWRSKISCYCPFNSADIQALIFGGVDRDNTVLLPNKPIAYFTHFTHFPKTSIFQHFMKLNKIQKVIFKEYIFC
jgi:hypothetical protein